MGTNIAGRTPALSDGEMLPTYNSFVATDFETVDRGPDSACTIGVVRLEARLVIHREGPLIRPPRSRILLTYVECSSWPRVATAPIISDVWSLVLPLLDGAAFLSAQNVAFDHRVLQSCCAVAALAPPPLPFVCSVQVSRKKWG